jgi:succinate dehydrogenase/fumarate reductase flavoprotein subunit
MDTLNLNRRDFFKVAGIGAAAFAIPGLIKNAKAASLSSVNQDTNVTDVLVIGGGIAGTFAALKAREQGAKVTLVDKGMVGRSGKSPWFGITAYYDESSGTATRKDWTEASMKATEYIAHKNYFEYFLKDSKDRWNDLASWGADKPNKMGHASLFRQQLLDKGIELRERIMITDLIKKDGEIVGAAGFPVDQDRLVVFRAKAVLICAGAGTFKGHGYAVGPITFDGHMMAYRAGAEISGKEWTDFHTFPVEQPTRRWGGDFGQGLLSTNSPAGHPPPFAAINAHQGDVPQAREQKPENHDGPPGGGGPPGRKHTGPQDGGVAAGRKHEGPPDGGRPPGRPPESEFFTMGGTSGMAEHHLDGIFPKGEKFSSTIPGLFAAGDALCTAGVGLLGSGSAVAASYAGNAGIFAAEYALNHKLVNVSISEINTIKERIFKSRQRDKGYSSRWVTQVMQTTMMPYYVLNVKKEDRLRAALTNIEFLRDHFCSNLLASNPHELRLALETENLILNAEMKLQASLFRTESRHNHYREDYPARDDANWLAWVIIQKNGDSMELTKRMLPKEWHPDPTIPYEKRYPNRFPGELAYRKQNHMG